MYVRRVNDRFWVPNTLRWIHCDSCTEFSFAIDFKFTGRNIALSYFIVLDDKFVKYFYTFV